MAIPVILVLLALTAVKIDHVNSANLTEVIQTKAGAVRGVLQSSSLSGITVQKFLNIPYAEAPVGQLRFEKPQAKKPWNEILESREMNIACFQKYLGPRWNLTEDCLILNVWTPYPKPKNASVMVWIHGGSFRSGSSGSRRHNGANFVAVGDVILVTINYRVSALGFFSTGDNRMKGNLGQYDQRLAMKWVKENIAAFGGNPKSITLFGLSSGAASVSAHTLSEESWPYFDRVILQSGNMFTKWATSSEIQRKAGVDKFLKLVKCENNDRVLECLKKNVTHQVLENIYKRKPFSLDGLWYRPTVDGEFLKEHPFTLLGSGNFKKSDAMLGVTKDEMLYTNHKVLQQTRNITVIQGMLKRLIKQQFGSDEVHRHALKLYNPDCIPSFIEAIRPMVDIMTDFGFTCAARNEAIVRSASSPQVFLYRYSYATPVPYSAYPLGNFGFSPHGADFLSVYGIPINNARYPAEDQILSMRIILYWTNFAKTGNPNSGTTKLPLILNNVKTLPAWPRHSRDNQEFLDMESLSRMTVRTKLRKKYCEFLNDPKGVSVRAQADTNTATSNVASVLLLLGLAILHNFS